MQKSTFYWTFCFFVNKPLISAMIETITGVKTITSVAILTLAAKAIGKIPNPLLLGPSRFL